MAMVCPHCNKLMSEQLYCPYCGKAVIELSIPLRQRLDQDPNLRYMLRFLLKFTILFPLLFILSGLICVQMVQLLL